MINLKRLLALAVILFAFVGASFAGKKEKRDSLRHELASATAPSDSIAIMVNIFDLSPNAKKNNIGFQILDCALRHSEERAAADIICWMAFANLDNDSVLKSLKNVAEQITDVDYQRLSQTYVSLRRAGYAARYASAKERMEMIQKAVDDGFFQRSSNGYDQISSIGSLCILLGSSNVHKNLIADYIDQAISLVETRPVQDDYLRNILYNYAIILYGHLGKPQLAAEIGRKRVALLDRMTQTAAANGRPYADYAYVYYSTYRGLLKNYEALTDDEIDEYYTKSQDIVRTNSDAAIANTVGDVDAFYLMAKGRYHEAIPKLYKALENSTDNYLNHRLLKMLMTAAQKIDDKETLYDVTSRYNRLLEYLLEADAQEAYTKMQVAFDIDELQNQNTRLVTTQKEVESDWQRKTIIAGVVIAVILLIAIGIIGWQYKRARKLIKSLATTNNALRKEGEILRQTQKNLIETRDKATRAEKYKTELIDNISHEISTPLDAIVEYTQLIVDCADSDKKKYLSRYGDIVQLNATLLQNIVNDIFDIGALEGRQASVNKSPVSIHAMCRMAMDSVSSLANPGVELKFVSENDPDLVFVTDAKRVEQVLINMLTNAEKFTESGFVHLSYTIDRKESEVSFIVTDTGPGIPKGKEEEIFQRFVKLEKYSQGLGLGLPICRMIANLLQGSIEVDKSYDKGARFIFKVPIL